MEDLEKSEEAIFCSGPFDRICRNSICCKDILEKLLISDFENDDYGGCN